MLILRPLTAPQRSSLGNLPQLLQEEPRGIFQITLAACYGELTSDRDLLIQLVGQPPSFIQHLTADRLLRMLDSLPSLERETTYRISRAKLLTAIFKKFGAPKTPPLNLKLKFSTSICPRKVKTCYDAWSDP